MSRVGLHFIDFFLLVLEASLFFGLSSSLGPGIGRDTLNFEDWTVIEILELLHRIGKPLSVH